MPYSQPAILTIIRGTAIFYFKFSDNTSNPTIHYMDLQKPILDFSIGQNNEIWVLLDAEYGKEEEASETVSMVSSLRFVDGEVNLLFMLFVNQGLTDIRSSF